LPGRGVWPRWTPSVFSPPSTTASRRSRRSSSSARPGPQGYDRPVPYFICPNCKNRSVDHDRRESLTDPTAVGCHRCGFGFLFELMDDYYAAPGTGMVVCDADGRIL